MPATPMNDAALKYSPEIAEAFHPTLTLRPATKKSCAVLDFRAAQKPSQIVAKTVSALKVMMKGSMTIAGVFRWVTELVAETRERPNYFGTEASFCSGLARATSASSRAIERRMKIQAIVHTAGKNPIPRRSQVSVKPNTRVAITSGKK